MSTIIELVISFCYFILYTGIEFNIGVEWSITIFSLFIKVPIIFGLGFLSGRKTKKVNISNAIYPVSEVTH